MPRKRVQILLLAVCLISTGAAAALTVGELRCESLCNPLGIDATPPRLSWVPGGQGRQTAYEIAVTGLWDSGKVASDQTFDVEYAGPPLSSLERCEWKVRIWDERGNASDWSQPAVWTMGLLAPDTWKADWIGYDLPRPAATNLVLPPPVLVRTAFRADKPIAHATMVATGLGWFDLYLNGRRVTDDRFIPGWTDYTRRVYYRTYDVTALVVRGKNALGAVIADGWFSGYVGYLHARDLYGCHPRLRAELHLEFADGTSAVVGTGPQWKAATGPEREADVLMGETYDARLALDGWARPDFDDRPWAPVATGSLEVQPKLEAHPGPPVREIAVFEPKRITEPKPRVYVLDLGQNFAGVARLKVGGHAGQTITLRYAERLNPDGTIYTTNLRSARATDTYICRGGGLEVWEPRFTFHGFQYIEVTGLTHKPAADTVVGVALGSDTPVAGAFACSDPMLNQLHSNIYWTQRANFIDVPTDCPQRDERLGWTGDAQVYVRTATLNCDVQAFYRKWLVDLCDDGQRADGEFPTVAPVKVSGDDGGPGWADAGVICPWTIYDVYGDRRELEQHYGAMTNFIAFCRNRCTPDLLPPANFQCFGDWLNIDADTPHEVIYLAYFARSTQLVARSAEALGKTNDAVKYSELFQEIKTAFNRAYVTGDGRVKGDTQAGYVLALAFDLVDGESAQRAARHLVENIEARGNHLSTGFIGTKDLMLVLAKIGRNDVASGLIHNDTFPSWGFSIKQGATSIWERWNGWTPEKGFADPGMNSFAHYSFGAVYQWMVENIGGIRNDGDAYRHIIIAPQPDGKLTWARTAYRSIRGRIVSNWKCLGGRMTMEVTIPANTTATIFVPAQSAAGIRANGEPLAHAGGLRLLRFESGHAVLAAQPGSYHFASRSGS